MNTKLKALIEKCKETAPMGTCESCGCTEKQCLDALVNEFTNTELKREELMIKQVKK